MLSVQQRAAAKDFVDIAALLGSGLSLNEMLGAARAVHGEGFNPVLTLKALSFYGDGDLHLVADEVREALAAAVKTASPDAMPGFKARETLCGTTGDEAFRHGF